MSEGRSRKGINLKHGHATRGGLSRTYSIWSSMLQRCHNPNHPRYKDYGARCIGVQPSWLQFENFLADMGEAPAKLTLERRDNNGSYTKDNCVWATAYAQAQNKRQYRNNTSGFVGVTLSPRGKWQAHAQRNGVRKTIGYFTSAQEAADRRAEWLASN